MKKASYMSAF